MSLGLFLHKVSWDWKFSIYKADLNRSDVIINEPVAFLCVFLSELLGIVINFQYKGSPVLLGIVIYNTSLHYDHNESKLKPVTICLGP